MNEYPIIGQQCIVSILMHRYLCIVLDFEVADGKVILFDVRFPNGHVSNVPTAAVELIDPRGIKSTH